MRQRRAAVATGRRIEVEAQPVAGLQRDAPAGNFADAEFRSLQVDQNADRPADFGLHRAHGGVDAAQILVVEMAHVEPEDVGAGVEQRADRFRLVGGGTERGDDFDVAAANQGGLSLSGGGLSTSMTRKSLTFV